VATHRIHHQFSIEEGDPHSPIDGKWWAQHGLDFEREVDAS
jgi:stearoyl-CoA desaturase (delta-9 desaturase)